MSSITVNLEKEVNFVLSDEEDRIVAIINVPQGTTDIDNKLANAIADDTGESFEYFQTELHIELNNSARQLQFDAFTKDSDDDDFIRTFYLTRTEIY